MARDARTEAKPPNPNHERITRTKTGCITCKIRRIKCDEAKPSCLRCTSTGRKCDGYVYMSSSPPCMTITCLSGRANPTNEETNWLSSEDEKLSFQYFQTKVSGALGGYFHLPFWSREVLQAAVVSPPLRYLVVALGSMYRSFEINSVRDGSSSSKRTEFAIQQCNRSLPHLNHLLARATSGECSHQSVHCILTASVLLSYLSTLEGHLSQAISHARSGLQILHALESNDKRCQPTPRFPVPLSRVRSLLTSLYGQARAMVDDESLSTDWMQDPLVSDLQPVLYFLSIEDAHTSTENLFHNTLAFLQSVGNAPFTTPEEVEIASSRHSALRDALIRHQDALNVLATQESRVLQKAADEQQDDPAIDILRVYHALIDIRLCIPFLQPANRESSFDHFEGQLESMLILVKRILQTPQAGLPRCQSGLGVVMPLHMVAARCRHPHIRREAICLLQTCGRRDGLWDSQLTGNIAAKTLQIEEESMSTEPDASGTVPIDERVREIKITFEGSKQANLRYITVGNWKRSEAGVTYQVNW